jgi:hypothetical protein
VRWLKWWCWSRYSPRGGGKGVSFRSEGVDDGSVLEVGERVGLISTSPSLSISSSHLCFVLSSSSYLVVE